MRRVFRALGLLALLGCAEEGLLRPYPNPPPPPPAPVPESLTLLSGDNQDGTSGDLLPQPFLVVVRDGTGLPVPGTWIKWALVSGAGDFGAAPTEVRTGGDGMATIRFRPVGPGEHRVRAEVQGFESLAVTFTARSTGPAVLSIPFGPLFDCTPFSDPSRFNVGPGPFPFGVQVEWKYVDWIHPSCTARIRSVSVPPGGALFDSGVLKPGNGVVVPLTAQGDWVFEDVINGGRVTLRVAGSTLSMIGVEGSFQQGISGEPLPQPLSVWIVSYGGALPPVQVVWRVMSGAGDFITQELLSQGASGVSRVTFRPRSIGPITIAAELPEAIRSPVLFSVNAIGPPPPPPPPAPGAPAVAVVTGSGQAGLTTEYFAEPLVVRVSDAEGHGIGGARVRWVVEAGSGEFSVRDRVTTTRGDGIAMIGFRPHTPGSVLVNARAEGFQGSGASFALSASGPRIALIPFGPSWDCSGMDDAPTSLFQLPQGSLPVGSYVEWEYERQVAGGCFAMIRSVAVPSGGLAFESGRLEPGQRFVVRLNAAGTWIFEDQHNGGQGSVVVVP